MSQEYDYTKSGRNIYRRSPSPKPALVDHSKLFQEDVALWRKKEEIMEKEHAEDVAEHAFIAKAVVGSLADAKNIHKKTQEYVFAKELKPYIHGQNKITYGDYSDTMSVFKKSEGFMNKLGWGKAKLEFTPGFLNHLDDTGNMAKFLQSQEGQEILQLVSDQPEYFDRFPGFTKDQWKDLEEHGGGSTGWDEYIKSQGKGGNPIWQDSSIFQSIDTSDISYSPLSSPNLDSYEDSDFELYTQEDQTIDSEVTSLLNSWDYVWDDNLWEEGGTV